jgi:hypothetical protein
VIKMTLNEKIADLQEQLTTLSNQINAVQRDTQTPDQRPRTSIGGSKIIGSSNPIDPSSGRGAMSGGYVIWNNTEISSPYGIQPEIPTIGYNKHSHSRFSGGALIKDVLEFVEYDWGTIDNKHSQRFFKPGDPFPQLATEQNSDDEPIEKIGLLDLIFNPDTKTWGVSAYELDIKKCYFVEKDKDGNIVKDENGNDKKAPIYNENQQHSSIIWDKNGREGLGCWRFLAVYASGDE